MASHTGRAVILLYTSDLSCGEDQGAKGRFGDVCETLAGVSMTNRCISGQLTVHSQQCVFQNWKIVAKAEDIADDRLSLLHQQGLLVAEVPLNYRCVEMHMQTDCLCTELRVPREKPLSLVLNFPEWRRRVAIDEGPSCVKA